MHPVLRDKGATAPPADIEETEMKIKSKKTTVETVVAKKTAKKATAKPAQGEKKVVFTVRAEKGR